MLNNFKILITTGIFPPDIGGPATYAETLAKALAKRGYSVCVLTYSKSFFNKDHYEGFKVVRVWSKWPIFIKHFIFGLKVLNLALKSDVVFSLNVWSAGFPSFLAARFFKKRFIVKIVGDYAWEVGIGKGEIGSLLDDFQKSKKKGWTKILFNMQGWICRKADVVIVPSKYLAGIVLGWRVPESKIKIIYNGVDFIRSDIPKEEARNKIGIHGNIILSVGRLVQWKGFRMLIKIMPQLLNFSQFARLVIVGDGPDRESLVSMVKNLNLEKKVYLAGKKSKAELAVYLAAADMFVLNTGYEGFSHQILEAMSSGIPVISTAVGGNREILRQGENGFLVKYNDEFNIIEAIKALWADKELAGHFIEEGKKTVQKFSSEKMVEETVKILTNDQQPMINNK